MNTSDWVLIGTSLFLGATALFVPWLAELVKRKAFAPKLDILYDRVPPYCHRTYWRSPVDPNLQEPVYYFRFEVVNEGQTQARLCEVVLEDLWMYDASGQPNKLSNFSPVNLHWASIKATFLSINPHRRGVFCDIGHISSSTHQKREEHKLFIDVPGRGEDGLRFLFDQLQYPYAQPNCLAPGQYAIKVSLYSENASPQSVYFKISWSGTWQNEEQEMFRECVVQQVNGP
jgi:hypothetical protein